MVPRWGIVTSWSGSDNVIFRATRVVHTGNDGRCRCRNMSRIGLSSTDDSPRCVIQARFTMILVSPWLCLRITPSRHGVEGRDGEKRASGVLRFGDSHHRSVKYEHDQICSQHDLGSGDDGDRGDQGPEERTRLFR